MLLNLMVTWVMCVAAPSQTAASRPSAVVIPRPQIEVMTGKTVTLTTNDKRVRIAVGDQGEGSVREGVSLLTHRLRSLGYESIDAGGGRAEIVVERCTTAAMTDALARQGIQDKLDRARLRQSYRLAISDGGGDEPPVRLVAAEGLGLYYGLVTLCQLVDADSAGQLRLPAGEIVDFPEIAHRLAKLSAEKTPPETVARFAASLSLAKLSQIGLQYHGDNSKKPEGHFHENITRLCPQFRKTGLLESIVYFCPFRQSSKPQGAGNGAYDLSSADDRQAYARYLTWILEQGAHGIEVDYNDWPDKTSVPISDVLNLACKAIEKQYPDAYVLYCPPAKAKESYRGPASAELRHTLSLVPARVWPLWTGPRTLIQEPLEARVVEEWTRAAGRRPFLWVNRTSPGDKQAFCRRLPGPQGGPVFDGELLPRDLNRLFEGVHLNGNLFCDYVQASSENEREAIIYLMTTGDFLWNPRAWDAAESCKRARHFAEMVATLAPARASAPAK